LRKTERVDNDENEDDDDDDVRMSTVNKRGGENSLGRLSDRSGEERGFDGTGSFKRLNSETLKHSPSVLRKAAK
jgi:hypothetical protein